MMQRLTSSLVAFALVLVASSASAQERCSQPLSDGDRPTVGDCIQIVRSVIGPTPCRDCICDVDGSGDVALPDALRCLWAAIGHDVDLECPACLETTTTLPGCATCGEALLGFATRAELCEEDAVLYDGFKQCLCSCCDEIFCRGQEPQPPACRVSDALNCLKVDCADEGRACLER